MRLLCYFASFFLFASSFAFCSGRLCYIWQIEAIQLASYSTLNLRKSHTCWVLSPKKETVCKHYLNNPEGRETMWPKIETSVDISKKLSFQRPDKQKLNTGFIKLLILGLLSNY